MTEEEALLAAIRANPASDLERLVYADWLDENAAATRCEKCGGTGVCDLSRRLGVTQPVWGHECGVCRGKAVAPNANAARADFIRTQVHAARCTPCRECSAWSRRDCPDPNCAFGLDDRALRHLLDHTWVETRGVPQRIGQGRDESGEGLFWRRGFVRAAVCRFADWYGTWETAEVSRMDRPGTRRVPTLFTPGLGPGVARAHPVESVRATDRAPHWNGRYYCFYSADRPRPSDGVPESAVLPADVFECVLRAGLADSSSREHSFTSRYVGAATAAEATSWVSEGLLSWARSARP
jgi:uncharacterized protein (TIGR02996 family)